ncbi:hypothetical protein [Jeotgalibacillus soli]|uniref:Uncharacterized protein n=1 Tax=Jeotgalibacillus soli TaxID=889306 RepID=A0A0C2S766_9BACL|nr:hypothetical protein [Jeotgalibacillus soli]KIL49869.1 hypothetical protein KP78_13370 [Jeotgalibacillus soli]
MYDAFHPDRIIYAGSTAHSLRIMRRLYEQIESPIETTFERTKLGDKVIYHDLLET